MKKLIQCAYGNGLALGVWSDNQEEYETEMNNLYNYRVTDGDPVCISDNNNVYFGYVLTDEQQIISGFKNRMMNELRSNNVKHRVIIKNKRVSILEDLAMQAALKEIEKIQHEPFLYNESEDKEQRRHSLGNIDNCDFSNDLEA